MFNNRSTLRTSLKLELRINELFKTGSRGIHDIDSPIEVTDVSESGIGFTSECILPEGYLFEISLTVGDHDPYFTRIKILYSMPVSKSLVHYGCSFDQLSSDLREIIRTIGSVDQDNN